MQNKFFVWGILVIVALALIGALTAPASAQQVTPQPTADYVPGEILVKYKPTYNLKGAEQALRARGFAALPVSTLDVLIVPVVAGQELATIETLRNDPNVMYAEPDYIAYTMDLVPNDPAYNSQWGLPKTNAPNGWSLTTGDPSVIIAIVDTGVSQSHPDLNCSGKFTAGWDFVNKDSDPSDDVGHGTHVAGIAAACTNNGTGVAGMAWNARLMPVKVIGTDGTGSYSNIAAGIYYAVDNGAKVINLSLAGPNSSSILADAVQYAHDHNVLVVAAAGNNALNGNYVMYPAAYPTVLAVAATDSGDNHASFSEVQPYVGVAAPGVNIYSTYFNIYYSSNTYATMSGTSMATPHVAGLAALIDAIDPALTVDEVKSLIETTADDLGAPGKDNYFGYGRINVGRALSTFNLGTTPPKITILADDSSAWPISRIVQVTTASALPITWKVTIPPADTWLSIAPPGADNGLVTASAPQQFTLDFKHPAAYGVYHTSITINGDNGQGGTITTTIEATLSYVAHLQKIRFPLIAR